MAGLSRNAAISRGVIEIEGIEANGNLKDFSFATKNREAVEIAHSDELSNMRTLGQAKVNPLKFTIAMAGAKAGFKAKLDKLLSRSTGGGDDTVRWSGVMHRCDLDNTILESCEFTGGLVKELEFIGFDANGKDSAWMTIEILPEDFKIIKGSGKAKSSVNAGQKLHQAFNFRADIQGCDPKGIISVKGLKVTQEFTTQWTGEGTVAELIPAGLKYSPSVDVEIQSNKIQTWQDWKNEVDAGNVTLERTLSVSLMDPAFKQQLFTVHATDCSLMDLVAAKAETGKAEGAKHVAKLLPYRIEFDDK